MSHDTSLTCWPVYLLAAGCLAVVCVGSVRGHCCSGEGPGGLPVRPGAVCSAAGCTRHCCTGSQQGRRSTGHDGGGGKCLPSSVQTCMHACRDGVTPPLCTSMACRLSCLGKQSQTWGVYICYEYCLVPAMNRHGRHALPTPRACLTCEKLISTYVFPLAYRRRWVMQTWVTRRSWHAC